MTSSNSKKSSVVSLSENDNVMFMLNGGVAPNCGCVAATVIHLTVVKVSDKAICLSPAEADTERVVWVPKSALKVIGDPVDNIFSLKNWFRFDSYQSWFFDKFSKVSALG